MRKFISILFLSFGVLWSQNHSSNKIIVAQKISVPIVLDGLLNEPVWKLCKPIDDFLQQEPIPGKAASFKTEVYALYDDKNLYIGVMCYDPEPSKIIARELKTDGNLRGDDNFTLLFDTFNDKKSAYWFGTNPLGMRDDALLSGMDFRGFNEDWNGIWDVRAAITDSGWSIEFIFPFSTFKFHDRDEQVWGVNFQRQIRRLNEQVLWSGVGLNLGMFKLAYAGTLKGIEGIKRGDPVYIKPFISMGFEQSEEEKIRLFKPGLDIKYGITQNLSLDLTFNTDFSQVESDRMKINLTRFPLFLPEKRDFFLENSSIFDYTFGFRNNVFYSRRIGLSDEGEVPVIAGARLVGRINKTELGFLNVQTASKKEIPTTNYTVARVKYDLLKESYAGFIITNKISKSGFNRVYGGDFNFTLTNFWDDQTIVVGGGAVKSDETNGGKQSLATKFFISYPNDLINSFFSYRNVQKDFNPEMGFFFRTGFKSLTYRLGINPRINFYGIKKLNFEVIESDIYWNKNNELSTVNLSFSPLGFTTNAEDRFGIQIQRNFDYVEEPFTIFDTTVIPRGKYWFNIYAAGIQTARGRKFFGGFELITGNYYNGKINSFQSSLTFLFSKHLTISGDLEINKLIFSNATMLTKEFGARIRYDFTTMIYTSIFTQWNNELKELNINYRFNWQPKIGSNIYLVFNHLISTAGKIKTKDIAVIAKIVWLIMV